MKSIKYIITIVCILLTFSLASAVSAEEGEFSGILSKTVEVSENGDVEVSIDIAGNPGIIALILDVSYDSDVLTLKEDGYENTELLKGKVDTTLTANPFRLGWQDGGTNAANNYSNGTLAKLYFTMKEGFYGTTEIAVDIVSAQTFVNNVITRPPAMENATISVTREKLKIQDGVVVANNLNGETLVVASYAENRMVDCKIYPAFVGDLQIQADSELNTTGATRIKAFLLESMGTLMPVHKCAEEKL